MQLFPTQFHDAKPFSSFNVMDLETVDDGVWQVSPHQVTIPQLMLAVWLTLLVRRHPAGEEYVTRCKS